MSTLNPNREEYESEDHLRVAKDIAWVLKTLYGAAAVFVLATVWVLALANDVKTNSEKIEEAATKEQVQQVITLLQRVESKVDAGDERQRAMKTQLDKLESKVDEIEKRDE